jgi:NitT/TauT family transport system permease protein
VIGESRLASADSPQSEAVLRGPRGGRRLRELAISVGSAFALLAAWELLVRAGILDRRFFPPPSEVLVTLFRMIRSGELAEAVTVTLARLVVGFVAGSLIGVVVGLLMGLSRLVRAAMQPVIGAIYPIPKIAILPLVMLIFGLGDMSRYVIVAIGVVFLVLLNTAAGVMSIEPIYLDVGRNFGAGRFDMLRTIALPGSLPLIFTGLRLAWGTGLLLIVAAEFVGARSGLGYLIWNSWQTFSVDEMYAGLVVISAIGLLSFAIFDFLEGWLVPWRAGR